MENRNHEFDFFLKQSTDYKPTVAISSCLIGRPVRYDGTGKLLTTASYLTDKLTLIEVCPEVGAGMSVSRPPIQFGSGLQAHNVQKRMPWLPLREETDLETTHRCRQFILQCRVYRDLRIASETVSLPTLHQHYLPLINTMDTPSQNELQQWQRKENKEQYWAVFMMAISRKLDSVNS